MAKDNKLSLSVMLPMLTTAKTDYEKPYFQVILLNIEAPLLSGSNQPTSKKLPTVNPINDGGEW